MILLQGRIHVTLMSTRSEPRIELLAQRCLGLRPLEETVANVVLDIARVSPKYRIGRD